ncbi:MAG TPA: sulfatase-like hydrolase/transferase [Xanthobacteraceae bacterium]|nr:sulfatase-like hydrolase/transferase [Xanthobacteraceae bacterium]
MNPNFILFITDQQRADFLGCYGHPILRTPHIDSIAARGVLFDRFYVASPVCMPNRASLMTGRMPSVHGVRHNGVPLGTDAVTFVDLLRDAGYATALVGKSHLQNFTGQAPLAQHTDGRLLQPSPALAEAVRHDLAGARYAQESPAFWTAKNPRLETPYYGFDHVELVTGHGDTVGGDYAAWLRAQMPHAERLLGPHNALPGHYVCPQAYRTAVPAELYHTAYIAARAAAYLAAHATSEQPFFLMVSFPDPHHPFNPPGRYWDMYDPDDFPPPAAFSRNDWTPPPHVAAVHAARERGTAALGGMNTIAVTAREAQEARALTCGMIACIDDAIGAVLAALGESGRADDTVTIFTSDHGDHLGDHRLLLKGAEQYQSILRVPFIWADPHAGPRGVRSAALASTIDIPATILTRAALGAYAGLQGRSLLGAIADPRADARDAVFIQYDHQRPIDALGGPPRAHTLVDERWRLSLYAGVPWGELYDLAGDPGEFDNLWDSPAHAAVKARLIENLLRAEIDHVDRVPLATAMA